jgi:PAS domain S-box-containing protein
MAHGIGDGSYYRDVCDQIGIALVTTDAELRIRSWNAAAARMFGAAVGQMLGTSILSIIPTERRAAADRMLRRALDLGENSEFEFDHRDTSGQHRELAAAVAPIIVESGERIGASLCVRDITRRINLQTELDETRKMAALGEMAGAIAHHFNNVLGGIVTSIDYAMENQDVALTRRMLQQVSNALIRTSSLVNGLLAFAEGGPRADDLADLTEVLNELADETELNIASRGIEFSMSLPKLPVTPVPRTQLLTVLRNIIQNAIEAMPQGGSLRITADISDDENIALSISDTGCGIDEVTKSRMFEPFWTTKGVLSASTGRAAGLGLAIAHGIVQRMGGGISVESEPSKGATLTVTIPLHPSARPDP